LTAKNHNNGPSESGFVLEPDTLCDQRYEFKILHFSLKFQIFLVKGYFAAVLDRSVSFIRLPHATTNLAGDHHHDHPEPALKANSGLTSHILPEGELIRHFRFQVDLHFSH
jgi:hypothetical protein